MRGKPSLGEVRILAAVRFRLVWFVSFRRSEVWLLSDFPRWPTSEPLGVDVNFLATSFDHLAQAPQTLFEVIVPCRQLRQ